MPFNAYILSVEVKFFLSLHKWSGLPRWTSYAFFLPVLIVIENVLSIRMMVIDNCKSWLAGSVIGGYTNHPLLAVYSPSVRRLQLYPFGPPPPTTSGDPGSTATGGLNITNETSATASSPGFYYDYAVFNGYRLEYFPFYGPLQAVMYIYSTDNSDGIPTWLKGYRVNFGAETWVQVLVWLFLIVPITVFTYYIYESRTSRKFRAMAWGKLFKSSGGGGEKQVDDPASRGRGMD